MNEELQEEIILKIETFKQQLSNLISSSKIPIYILTPIIANVLSELDSLYKIQVQKAIVNYNKKESDLNEKENKGNV